MDYFGDRGSEATFFIFSKTITIQQVALPVLGILAAASITFYAMSFAELREKSFRDLEESTGNGGFESSMSSRKRRARRTADKDAKP
ncbi:uncharacterized protein LOC113750435 [Coffea eugenioides]|uniref:uncharacterized protein LOC113750435 n=1 Tax=Coffea eugenioides TaxID=49369 RepID=UPI000F60FA5B|nr:uncharacterized protein LOC113750435 [Coffea eugenioides]